MGKSFNNKGFFDDYDYEVDSPVLSKKPNKKNDKKYEIQQARKKAQAERDKAISELLDSED